LISSGKLKMLVTKCNVMHAMPRLPTVHVLLTLSSAGETGVEEKMWWVWRM
jgi:hypothetical protein